MVKLVKLHVLTTRRNQVASLVMLIASIMIILCLFNYSLNYMVKISATALSATVLLMSSHVIFKTLTINKVYSNYQKLLGKLVYDEKRVYLKPKETSKVYVSIYKETFKRSTRVGIEYRVVEKTNSMEYLDPRPYVFMGYVEKLKGRQYISSFYYEGYAYLFTYNGVKYLLIPLYPSKPDFEKRILKTTHGRDYGELNVKKGHDGYLFNILYIRSSSRELNIVLEMRSRWNTRINMVIARVTQGGRYEYKLLFPTLKTTHLIIIPLDKRFISKALIDLEDLVFEGEILRVYPVAGMVRRVFLTGYGNLRLKLVLNLQPGRRTYSETILKPVVSHSSIK